MIVLRAQDYKEMSRKAANMIASQVIIKPNSVIGLATGSSPVGTYERLIELYSKGDIDFSCVKTVNLDEYKGLSADNDQSYRYFMEKNLFGHVNINKENINIPNGLEADIEKECLRYDSVMDNLGGIDMQLLGLGLNGHIGFNEPAEIFQNNTNCVRLTQSTIDANKRFFEREEDVPKYAYTMGIGSIMRAKKIVMVVSGKAKAGIIKEAFFGPVTPHVPASILQMHNDFTLIGDEEALSLV
jgi:glucosamine-6-phosphate deaminase